MIQTIKELIKQSPFNDTLSSIHNKYVVRDWKKKGEPDPPPHVIKQNIIKDYAKRFSTRTFIKTGTFHGYMINAIKDTFDKIFSIELDEALFQKAKEKFAAYPHISILHGDSATVIPQVLEQVTQPCLFWLDGHYSGGITAKGQLDTPIIQELEHIFKHDGQEQVILIDDARLFNGENDYPTVEELQSFIHTHHPNMVFEVEHDIIRIHKK